MWRVARVWLASILISAVALAAASLILLVLVQPPPSSETPPFPPDAREITDAQAPAGGNPYRVITFLTNYSPDEVFSFYRAALTKEGWRSTLFSVTLPQNRRAYEWTHVASDVAYSTIIEATTRPSRVTLHMRIYRDWFAGYGSRIALVIFLTLLLVPATQIALSYILTNKATLGGNLLMLLAASGASILLWFVPTTAIGYIFAFCCIGTLRPRVRAADEVLFYDVLARFPVIPVGLLLLGLAVFGLKLFFANRASKSQ